jgi:phosphoserine phosphatase
MSGELLFENSLKDRLALMKPSRIDLIECVNNNSINLSPNIDKVIKILHDRGIPVYLVSGGFRQMIKPIADLLNIPSHRIYSNNIIFESNGSYKGFDEDELTSKDKGKGKVIELLKESFDYDSIVMIGDGYTDLQARTDGPAG